MTTRVRITDPAKVIGKYQTFDLRLTGKEFAVVVGAVAVAPRVDEESWLAVFNALRRAKAEPDLPAIAAALEAGESVSGAELESE